MARSYKRDKNGRFAGGGGGGGSRGGGSKPIQRGTNRLTRDNAGRITSQGGDGATARGGRLATASGNKRATQTAKLSGGGSKGTVGKPKGLKPGAIKPKAAAPAAKKPMTKAEYEAAAKKAWGPGWNAKGSKPKQTADQQLDRIASRSRNMQNARTGLTKAEAAKASELSKQTGRRVRVTQNENGSFAVTAAPARRRGTVGKPKGLKPGSIKPKAAAPSRSGRGKAPQSRVPSAASDSFKYNKSGQIASPAERAKMRGRERHHEKQMLLAEKRQAGVLKAQRRAARDVERGRITPVENSYAASNAKRAHDRRIKRAGQNFGAGGVDLMRRESALTQKAKRIEAKAAERKAAGKAVTPRMQAEHADLRRQILKAQKSQATRKRALGVYEGTKNRIEANIRSRSRYSY